MFKEKSKSEATSKTSESVIQKNMPLINSLRDNLHVVGGVALIAGGGSLSEPGSYYSANITAAFAGMIDNWAYANRLESGGYAKASQIARWASVAYAANALMSTLPFAEHISTGQDPKATWVTVSPIIAISIGISQMLKGKARKSEMAERFRRHEMTIPELEEYKCDLMEQYSRLSKKSGFHVHDPKAFQIWKLMKRVDDQIMIEVGYEKHRASKL